MKAPISWLKDFINIDITTNAKGIKLISYDCTEQNGNDSTKVRKTITIPQLVEKFVSCGFEIEEIIDLSKKISGVRTGKIVDIQKHTNANKLSVCTLDMSDKKLQIVTGATNVYVGAIVPVATDGAILPGGKVINSGELRGVLSEGMLCSGKELDVDDYDIDGAEVDGILILSDKTQIGADINPILGNDEIVLDVSITANRPDCNSIIGLARELAASLGIDVTERKLLKPNAQTKSEIAVTVLDTTLCPNYIAQEIRNIKITRSPKWLTKRLKMTDHKPYNNIVDLTNYLLVELGQPMHAFDKATLDEIIVRRANNGEKITILSGEERVLDENALVICNSTKALAIAGIMGGEKSSISSTTDTIVLESAKFAKESVRRTSRRINVRSDSSARYEKGIDLYTQTAAIERAVDIILREKWGEVPVAYTQLLSEKPFDKTVKFTTKDIEGILGVDIDVARIVNILTSLQFAVTVENTDNKASKNATTIIAKVPPYREDVDGVNDIAEELIRFYGYDKIDSTLMDKSRQTIGGIGNYNKFAEKIKNLLVGNGLYEIVTYSFTTPKFTQLLSLPTNDKLIKLLNPLGEELSVMRDTLAHSMLEVLSTNFAKGNKKAMLYEFGRTYIADKLPLVTLPTENNVLSIGMYGDDVDYYTLKNIIDLILNSIAEGFTLEYTSIPYMHGGRTAKIIHNNKDIGYLGEIHPTTQKNYEIDKRCYICEINLDNLYAAFDTSYSFVTMSKYQPVTRDLALVISQEVTAQSILSLIKSSAPNMTSVNIFDVYSGEQVKKGYKSVAVKMEFRADKTLTDTEIISYTDGIINALRTTFNATIRA